jgi:hypothetical protein
MDQLKNLFKMTPNLVMSQLIFLKEWVEEQGGEFEFLHKFAVRVKWSDKLPFVIKLNVLDGEIFILINESPVAKFRSVKQVKEWLKAGTEIRPNYGTIEWDSAKNGWVEVNNRI